MTSRFGRSWPDPVPPSEESDRQFDHFRESTTLGGVHVVFAFVDHPDVPTPPDWTDEEHVYAPGELRTYYEEWETLDERELVFEDDSEGHHTNTPPRYSSRRDHG